MLHQVFGRKLNRSSNERKRLFKNLSRSLILNGYIKTTFAKAKSIQPLVERLVTKAKNGNINTKRLLIKHLSSEEAAEKLIKEIAPLFKKISGGYTRIIKTEKRLGDNTQEVVLNFTVEISNSMIAVKAKKELTKKEEKVVKETKKVDKNAKK